MQASKQDSAGKLQHVYAVLFCGTDRLKIYFSLRINLKTKKFKLTQLICKHVCSDVASVLVRTWTSLEWLASRQTWKRIGYCSPVSCHITGCTTTPSRKRTHEGEKHLIWNVEPSLSSIHHACSSLQQNSSFVVGFLIQKYMYSVAVLSAERNQDISLAFGFVTSRNNCDMYLTCTPFEHF